MLSPELKAETDDWLDQLESSIARIENCAPGLSEDEARALHDAIADVRTVTSFARAMFAGSLPMDERVNDRWTPLVHPSPALAALVHSAGDSLGGTPWPLIERAKATLPESQRRPFLLVVGSVLGSVFTNLTRAVWNDYPQFAPQGWNDT